MEIKFFPRDVIGKQPKKAGDKFKASFMGSTLSFTVTEMGVGFFMAEMA